jgi:hypothetical protein
MYVVTIPRRMDEARSREAGERQQDMRRRERYGKSHCPDAFVDICWEFNPADAAQALSEPPPWETYERIVEHLRAQPMPLDDKRSPAVYQGLRRSLMKENLVERRYAQVISDAARFLESSKPGDGLSAAMLLSALTQTLLPARIHLSTPDERRLGSEVAALLVPAFERALAELSDAAKHERLRIDDHGAAYTLARAELCLGSAYEYAAFVEENPAEKKRLLAKALAVYARAASEVKEGDYWRNPSAYWINPIGAFVAASRVAASDDERLELARRTVAAMSAALNRVGPDRYAASGVVGPYDQYYIAFSSFRVSGYLYNDVPPATPHPPSLFGGLATYASVWKRSDGKTFPVQARLAQTWINQAILAVWEDYESAEARRAALDTLIGLYAVRRNAGDAYKGAIARLMLELYTRSGDEHWLNAAPAYMRAGGDTLPAVEWKKLVEKARRRHAELVAQRKDPKVCRDSDGLVIRRRDADLITKPLECAATHAFITRHPLASEIRPALLGAKYGNERQVLESIPRQGSGVRRQETGDR